MNVQGITALGKRGVQLELDDGSYHAKASK